ncbi:MAG: pitrilysin family protein [Candidatus Eisenbacteria bacterium]
MGHAMNVTGYSVEEYRLSNGLLVLLLPAHEAPVVCVSVWYRAGSREDPPGRGGTAHLLEHMLYKGTQRYPKGVYDQVLHRLGGITNASTSHDRTNFYILITRDRYPRALELEADRMRGAAWGEDDFRDEVSVVLNELEQNEDDPGAALFDRLQAEAFLAHPYGRPVIGRRAEVETLTSGDLRTFYDRHYQPANSFLVIAGDFETGEMREQIERTFGSLPSPPAPSRPPVCEAEQARERRIELRKAGGHELHMAGYKVPARHHPDSYALDVLAHALGQGRLSRLYRALVEPGFAVQAVAENQTMGTDPFLFVIDVEPALRVPAERVAAILDEEIARIVREGIRADELERACKRARVGFILRRERVSSRAFLIGESEALGSWRLLESYLDQLDRVTVEGVAAAARRYLTPTQRTWAHFIPVGPPAPVAGPSAEGR